MTYQTTVNKGHDGWRAESLAVLGEVPTGTRKLVLSTSKVRGGLSSYASVYIYKEDENGFSSKETVIFQDFAKGNIAPTPCKRITERAVRDAHECALLEMKDLIKEAKDFYENLEAVAA